MQSGMLCLVGINIEIVGIGYMTLHELLFVLCRYMSVRWLNDHISNHYGSDDLGSTFHGEHDGNDKSLVL